MQGRYRWLIFVIMIIGALIGGYIIKELFVHPLSTQSPMPKIGIVRLSDVIKLNPSYGDYEKAKAELDSMKKDFEAEQFDLNEKSQEQTEELKNVASDPNYVQSLNDELTAKIKAKENELNEKLAAKRHELLAKYAKENQVASSDADLRIVNLQLGLVSKVQRIPRDSEDQHVIDAEKAAQEAELNSLLAKRGPSISANMENLKARVDNELKPLQEAGQKELNDYAASLHQELSAKRDREMQNRAKDIMDNHALPSPVEWSQKWSSKLKDKQAEVDALHQAILDDIEMRVAIIAEEKGLDLVVTDETSNISALDITDELIASYEAK